jgi:hypothetical protein
MADSVTGGGGDGDGGECCLVRQCWGYETQSLQNSESDMKLAISFRHLPVNTVSGGQVSGEDIRVL